MIRSWMLMTCLSGGYLMAEQEMLPADKTNSNDTPNIVQVGFFHPNEDGSKSQSQKARMVEAPKKSDGGVKKASRDPYGKNSIASYTNTEKKGRFFVTGDALYWKATEENLGYVAVTNTTVFQDLSGAPTVLDVSSVLDIKKPHLKYRGGFEVGFGCDFPPESHWDALVNWTDYRVKATGHENTSFVDPNTIPNPTVGSYQITSLTPLLIGNASSAVVGGSGFYNSASAAWRLHVDLLDLEIGRKMFLGKWVMLRPFLGLRGERIKENFHTFFLQPQVTNKAGGNVEVSARVHMKSNYDGIGIRMGMDSQWKIYNRLSFYGDAAASVLYGKEKLTAKNLVHTEVDGTAQKDSINDSALLFKNKQNASRAIFDFDAGLRWDQMFGQDRYHLGLNVGWAFRYFLNQSQMMRTTTLFAKGSGSFVSSGGGAGTVFQNDGYICLQGLVVGGQLDF